jgi:hypothetical protein
MKSIVLFLLLHITFVPTILFSQTKSEELILSLEDKKLVVEKLERFKSKAQLPVNELLVEIGLSFLETPYIVGSLENGPEEKMVINLRGLDCTTFVENCLALTRTVKSGNSDFESFVAELEKIRYRNGIRKKYPSRLHYFSEWVHNNHQKELVDELVNRNGIQSKKTINYMSTHPAQYPVLKGHPEMIEQIALQENEITSRGFWYFPQNDLKNLYRNLRHGDIIALTSTIEGIDINHVGIILKKNEEFYLLHAPLSGKKVLVSDGPISDFIKPGSKNNGIMIARPIF